MSLSSRLLPAFTLAAVAALAAVTLPAQASPAPWGPAISAAAAPHLAAGVRTRKQKAAVARTGVAIVEADHGHLVVTGTADELRAVQALVFPVGAAPAP